MTEETAILSCTDPSTLEGFAWFACYLTTGKHLAFYASFGTVLLLLAITAPTALLFGFAGASAARSGVAPLRWLGNAYIAIVRGVPDSSSSRWIRDSSTCATRSNAPTGTNRSGRATISSSVPPPSCRWETRRNGCMKPTASRWRC